MSQQFEVENITATVRTDGRLSFVVEATDGTVVHIGDKGGFDPDYIDALEAKHGERWIDYLVGVVEEQSYGRKRPTDDDEEEPDDYDELDDDDEPRKRDRPKEAAKRNVKATGSGYDSYGQQYRARKAGYPDTPAGAARYKRDHPRGGRK